jgi:hypothetical protein
VRELVAAAAATATTSAEPTTLMRSDRKRGT